MINSYDSKQEVFDREECRKECSEDNHIECPEESRKVCPDVSRDECPEELTHELTEKETEDNVRNDAFLRTNASDEETDSADKTRNTSDSKASNGLKESNECQTIYLRTDPKERVVVSSNSTGDSLSKTFKVSNKCRTTKPNDTNGSNGSKTFKIAPKWGESVGISDANGLPKRVVSMSEMKNYIPLRMKYRTSFKYYFALVDARYPQHYRGYESGRQRWRMRYNIFVDGMFRSHKKSDLLLHIGETMIYFDIEEHLTQPFYVNCSFYANYSPLNTPVDPSRLTKMIVRLHDILTSSLILQLKFPVSAKAFRSIDQLYYKFLMRQKELLDELEFINKHWTPNPMGRWLSIDQKRGLSDKNMAFDRRPIDRRPREFVNRSYATRVNEESAQPSAGNGSKNYKPEEQTVQRAEERGDRRFVNSNDKRNNRLAYGRTGDQVFVRNVLREKALNVEERAPYDRVRPKRSNQRRNQSVERMAERNSYLDARPIIARSGRNGDRRSRPKTRRR